MIALIRRVDKDEPGLAQFLSNPPRAHQKALCKTKQQKNLADRSTH
jgi:hypothetical protein